MGNVRSRVILFLVIGFSVLAIKFGYGKVLGDKTILESQRWSLIVGGDVMLGRSVNTRSLKYNDFNFPFLKINDLLSSSDLTMVNLETPVINNCRPTDSGMIFCAPGESLAGLKWSGVDVVNLDNNHSMNYGKSGYEETKNLLNKYEIGYFDDQTLWEKEIKGVKVGSLGYDLVSDHREIRIEQMLQDVSDKRKLVDVLIVNLHWGEEYVSSPSAGMKEIANRLVKGGASLVIGHHSHVIGKYSEIDAVPVIYSLGNLVFDQMWSEQTRLGMVVKFDFEGGQIVSRKFIPVKIFDYGQPREITDALEKDKIVATFLDGFR